MRTFSVMTRLRTSFLVSDRYARADLLLAALELLGDALLGAAP